MLLKYRSQSASVGVFALLFVIAVVVAIVLGIFCAIWALWTFVMPQVWVDGPQAIVNPGYWLFVCEWLLLGLVSRSIFGRREKKSD